MSVDLGNKSASQNDHLKPKAVTSVTATDVGVGRAFNDGAVDVSWTVLSSAETYPADNYILTVSTAPSSPIIVAAPATSYTVTGLLSNQSITVSVVASNEYGDADSVSSSSVTVTTVPDVPTNVVASSPSAGVDRITFTAPANNGGSVITNYHWTSDDSKSGDTTALTFDVSQEQGTAQTYTVYADNANGRSAASTASNSITTTFSFAPFGAFGFSPFSAFGFSPFGFSPFGFSPFGFSPFAAFGFSPFGAFGFSPFGFSPFGAFGFSPFGAFGFSPFGFSPYKR